MKITKANAKAVNFACKNFHYSKCAPKSPYAYNIYNDNDEWCGVICFGNGANNNIAKTFNLIQGEVLELTRVALNGKQEYTSQAVSFALKMLHKENPIVKIVVSYADNRQRHIGTIYQATNWLYLGKSDLSTDCQFFYNGKWTHSRTLHNIKDKELRSKLEKELPRRPNSDKFKYIFVFDKKLRKKYIKMSLPYPKDKDLTIYND